MYTYVTYLVIAWASTLGRAELMLRQIRQQQPTGKAKRSWTHLHNDNIWSPDSFNDLIKKILSCYGAVRPNKMGSLTALLAACFLLVSHLTINTEDEGSKFLQNRLSNSTSQR
jgi:hypothetical protein